MLVKVSMAESNTMRLNSSKSVVYCTCSNTKHRPPESNITQSSKLLNSVILCFNFLKNTITDHTAHLQNPT